MHQKWAARRENDSNAGSWAEVPVKMIEGHGTLLTFVLMEEVWR